MNNKYRGKVKQAPTTGRSMTFGNNDTTAAGVQTGQGDGSHTVRGIGRVQRAAAKRITGAAAVGAGIDAAEPNRKFPLGKAPGLHPHKKSHHEKDAIPSDKRTS